MRRREFIVGLGSAAVLAACSPSAAVGSGVPICELCQHTERAEIRYSTSRFLKLEDWR
jgi:hypothetical protein